MLARELESRERSKRARLLRQARFPVPKAVDGFDWSNVRFPEGWGRDEMLSLDFVGRAEDLVFHGPTGRGKTHVATALGIEATRRGVPVRFFQTATLVLQLGKAKREGALDRLLADVGRAELVILDEFGYVPFDVDGARLLYQVISDSYGEEEHRVHHERGVQPVGHGLRGRQARRRDRGPRRPPRQARRVRRPQPPARGVAHARQVRKLGACRRRKPKNLRAETRKKGALFSASET